MSLVIYNPATGQIKRLIDGSKRTIERAKERIADGDAYLEGDYTRVVGHCVTDGRVEPVERTHDDDMRALRKERDRLLRIHVDRMNPMRWGEMTQKQKADFRAYRRALLDLPKNTKTPRNPVWPTPPE